MEVSQVAGLGEGQVECQLTGLPVDVVAPETSAQTLAAGLVAG